jgi:hypothetical protein
MPYAMIRRAMEERHSLTAYYDSYVRHFSPRILGLDRQSWPAVVAYQYDGGRREGLPPGGDWCFFHVWGLSDLRRNADTWVAGPPQCRLRHLILKVDIQA